MSRRERMIMAPLVVMTLLLGVYPAVVTDITGASVGALITEFRASVPTVETVAAVE
jgi:NADH-quinone oxidoreductase subunit M